MYTIGDSLQEFGEITKLTNEYVWFGEKKITKRKLQDGIKGILYKESPDTEIDWSDPNQVDAYYDSFKYWKGVVRMGHSKSKQILQVKDNKILFEGEYYLPFYHTYKNTFSPLVYNEKVFLEDCYIFGWCMKLHNSFYDYQNDKTVNVFYYDRIIAQEQYKYGIDKQQWFKELETIDYLKKINFQEINSKDLNLLKENFKHLFDQSIFPYTINNVSFIRNNSEYNFQNCIEVHHRNRKGRLEIDNGYRGPSPFANDYYAILRCAPYFTNEHGTYVSVNLKDGEFDKSILEKLSLLIVKAWDRAIENNFTIYG